MIIPNLIQTLKEFDGEAFTTADGSFFQESTSL